MKKLYFIIMLIVTSIFLLPNESNGQSLELGTKYRFKSAIKLKQCTSMGAVTAGALDKDIEKNWQFFVEKVLPTTGYVISFPEFPISYHGYSGLNQQYVEDAAGNTIYYFLPLSEVSNVDVFYNRFFSYGAISSPFKARFGGGTGDNTRYFDLTSNISLGLSAGAGWSLSNSVSNHLLVSASITSVPLNIDNTKGFTGSSISVTALSPAVAYIHQRKSVQIGVFVGLDVVSGKYGKDWLYKNSPWIGLGVGLTLFTPNASSNEQTK